MHVVSRGNHSSPRFFFNDAGERSIDVIDFMLISFMIIGLALWWWWKWTRVCLNENAEFFSHLQRFVITSLRALLSLGRFTLNGSEWNWCLFVVNLNVWDSNLKKSSFTSIFCATLSWQSFCDSIRRLEWCNRLWGYGTFNSNQTEPEWK